MKLCMDSSSLAKRYIDEFGSDEVDRRLEKASELAVCIILVPEIISALNRRLREQFLIPRMYRLARRQLLSDIRDATVLQLTPAVISCSIGLLEKNELRAMDAMHIACAMEWGADLFVTSDKQQFLAARNTGLTVDYIGP